MPERFGALRYDNATSSWNWQVGETGYRYGFQGEEKNDEISGKGNNYDFTFRTYDARLGRFFSVDPLHKQFAWNSPYAFAENRVIEGIELEGLEYLSADDARLEFVSGKVLLKVENFTWCGQNNWKNERNKGNWTPGEIGLSREVGNIKFMMPKLKTTAELHDIPNEMMPDMVKGQSEGIRMEMKGKYNPNPQLSTSPRSQFPSKGMLVIEALNFTKDGVFGVSSMIDMSKLQSHAAIAGTVTQDMNIAVQRGMIPDKYKNTSDMSSIANVVLSGVSYSGNQEIYDLGMKIFNEVSLNKYEIIPQQQPPGGDNTVVKKPQLVRQTIPK